SGQGRSLQWTAALSTRQARVSPPWGGPSMSTHEPDDIVCLATAPNPMQAHVWEQALREEGIRCKVVGDYLDAGSGDIPGVRAEIWVHRDDVTAAQAVLKRLEDDARTAPPEEA